MSDLLNQLRNSFSDEDYRYAYADSFMNSYVAAQIKVLREQNNLTQADLGQKLGTQQAGISRIENVNYSAWKVETLRRLARAFGVRLRITFEEWGSLPHEIENFTREALAREPFEHDPVFSGQALQPVVLNLAPVPAVNDAAMAAFYRPAKIVSPMTVIQVPVQPPVFFPLNPAELINAGTITVEAAHQYLFGTMVGTHQVEEEILTNAEYRDMPLAMAATAGTSNMSLYSSGAPSDAN